MDVKIMGIHKYSVMIKNTKIDNIYFCIFNHDWILMNPHYFNVHFLPRLGLGHWAAGLNIIKTSSPMTIWSPHMVVTEKSRFCHITPVLFELHWLPVHYRINFKIATITSKVLQFQQPSYLAALIPRYVPTRSLRSSSSLSLCGPNRKTGMAKSKSFSSVASSI